jgi:hypothetical protein
MILINSNTRQFNIPGADLVFGVSGDSGSEVKHFQCPRYVGNNLDLMSCFVRINFRNANGKTDTYLVEDMAVDGDNITFSWQLSPRVTEYRGQVKFVMCAVGPDLKLLWHTAQGTGQVLEGLEPDNSHVLSQTTDVVAQLIAMVEEQTTAVERVGAEQVASVRSATEIARTAAVNEIEAKRANSLASIPNDYTALNGAVESLARGRGGAVVCEVEGTAVAVDDSSDMPIQGMRIFGRSTQDGIPTPDAPVEIVSVESPTVRVCGKNLFPGHVANYTGADGSTVKVNADGSITVHKVPKNLISFKEVMSFPPGTYVVSNGLDTGHPVYIQAFNATTNSSPNKVVQWPGGDTSVFLYSREDAEGDVTIFPQIELGAEPTPYEQYTNQNVATTRPLRGIPVTSGGNYTDANGQQWYCDEVDLERGVYVQRIREQVFNGTENITVDPRGNNTSRFVIRPTSPVTAVSMESGYCTHFPIHVDPIGTNARNEVIYMWTTGIAYARFDAITSVEGMVAWLAGQYSAGTPVKILYPVEKPIETPLTEAEIAAYRNLHGNYPNTTVLNDAGAHMVVKYAADTKLYIDKKIKEALQ